MKKSIYPALFALILTSALLLANYDRPGMWSGPELQNELSMKDFYDLRCQTLDGKDFDFSQLKGKRVLIVNTASECGYTPQYEQLQSLYETYGTEQFTIIGFPANNFGGQEPGSNSEIAEFCQKNYGVSFPMMAKVSVKGEDKHPVYRWLTQSTLNGKQDVEVEWNFNKFLIDENGHWITWLPSKISPLDNNITEFAGGA